jgi:hypothetical protein
MDEGFIEALGFGGVFLIERYFDSGGAQALKPFSADQRIRILHGGDYAAHTRFDDRVGTWPGPAVVRAGFQGDVQSCMARGVSRFAERHNLRVIHTGPGVKSPAHDGSVAHDNRANSRIRTRTAAPLFSQFESLAHVAMGH